MYAGVRDKTNDIPGIHTIIILYLRSVILESKTHNSYPKIGEVYMIKFNGVGSEQCGWRPALVFQNNVGNEHSPNIIVLPLTSRIKKMDMPTHVLVRACNTGLIKDSIVLCENPECVSKQRLGAYLTTLSKEYMINIAKAYLLATSAISYLNIEVLQEMMEMACRLNGC